MAINRLPVTKGLRAMLAAHTGKPFFLGRLPKDPASIPKPPYGLIYTLDAGQLTGPPLWDPDADATFVYQVTSVGLDETGAEWLADHSREAVVGRDPETGLYVVEWDVGAGQKIMARRSQAGAGATGVSEGMVTIAEQFAVSVTPA